MSNMRTMSDSEGRVCMTYQTSGFPHTWWVLTGASVLALEGRNTLDWLCCAVCALGCQAGCGGCTGCCACVCGTQAAVGWGGGATGFGAATDTACGFQAACG